MKRIWPIGLIIVGVVIIFLGFVYDVLFAGIPYQDPTPELLATYNFHAQIASIIRWAGLAIMIMVGLAWMIRAIMNNRQVPKD